MKKFKTLRRRLRILEVIMAGITGLLTRINKCQKEFWFLNRPMAVSTVNMNADGEIMWEREVTYNPNGVLVVPLSMSIDEWEQQS